MASRLACLGMPGAAAPSGDARVYLWADLGFGLPRRRWLAQRGITVSAAVPPPGREMDSTIMPLGSVRLRCARCRCKRRIA